MDRGVKIAIFAASIVSLGLGLIWDQVLSQARVIIDPGNTDVLAGETMEARMGSRDIARLELAPEFDTPFPIPDADPMDPPQAPEPPPAAVTEYTVKNGDSWWRIAHVEFKERGLSSEDLQKANPGAVLRPGRKILIPASKDAVAQAAQTQPAPAASTTPATPQTGEVEYVVKEGDSWWKIANVHFKDRGHTSRDIEAANPGVKLVPGAKVKIPAGR